MRAFTTPIKSRKTTNLTTITSYKKILALVEATMFKQFRTSINARTIPNKHTLKRCRKSRKAYTIKTKL